MNILEMASKLGATEKLSQMAQSQLNGLNVDLSDQNSVIGAIRQLYPKVAPFMGFAKPLIKRADKKVKSVSGHTVDELFSALDYVLGHDDKPQNANINNQYTGNKSVSIRDKYKNL